MAEQVGLKFKVLKLMITGLSFPSAGRHQLPSGKLNLAHPNRNCTATAPLSGKVVMINSKPEIRRLKHWAKSLGREKRDRKEGGLPVWPGQAVGNSTLMLSPGLTRGLGAILISTISK